MLPLLTLRSVKSDGARPIDCAARTDSESRTIRRGPGQRAKRGPSRASLPRAIADRCRTERKIRQQLYNVIARAFGRQFYYVVVYLLYTAALRAAAPRRSAAKSGSRN